MEKKDSRILTIASREIVAAEACYHRTCYKGYTRAEASPTVASDGCGESLEDEYANLESEAYQMLFGYIRSDVLANEKIVRLTEMTELLASYLTSLGVEEIKLSTKKHIRRNLQTEFGDVLFENLLETTSVFIVPANLSPLQVAKDITTLLLEKQDNASQSSRSANLLLKSHVNNICRSAFCALTNIGKIRRFLDQKTSASLVNALVISRLDHCNSLLIGLPQYELQKLQKVFNTAARIVTRTRPDAHITPVLKSLHWLPIEARLQFKILITVFKGLNNIDAPIYIKELLVPLNSTRTLRSSTKNLLKVPKSRTKTYGDRAFSVIGPVLWNKLPDELRHELSLNSFKYKLKTFLFRHFYE